MARIAVAWFVSTWLIAMWTYPGWNSFDPSSTGHDFLHNYLCDLLSSKTPDGRENIVGSIAMNAGVIGLIGAGLLPLWWRAASAEPWRSLCRVLGVAAALLTLVICIEQAFVLSLSHHVISLGAGAAGLLPTAFVAAKDWRLASATRLRRALLIGTIGAAIINFVSYALVQAGQPLTIMVPVSQKVALLCLLGWLAQKNHKAASDELASRVRQANEQRQRRIES